jgi:phosphatidylserine/phosphatidylglycerophosphate/cardiolipin synthase-like enzyme
MIVTAQRHVFVQSPYFVLDADIAEALRAAALSGVEVKVVLSARASGNKLPAWAGNTYIADVVGAGVRVFLYDKGYLHTKTISIDSEVCSIGSANIDIRSFSINYELNAVVYSERVASELEGGFRAGSSPRCSSPHSPRRLVARGAGPLSERGLPCPLNISRSPSSAGGRAARPSRRRWRPPANRSSWSRRG